jgi:phospholipase/lecithinase/hemolysin
VADLYPIDKLPRTLIADQLQPGTAALVGQITQAHDNGLASVLTGLSNTLSGINLIPLDVTSVINNAINNPGSSSFTNVTQACLDVLSCATADVTEQNKYLFWDESHLTSSGQQLIAQAAIKALNLPATDPTSPGGNGSGSKSVPEPSSVLGLLTLGVLGGGTMLKRQRKSKAVSKK